MKVVHTISEIGFDRNSIVTIGTYDGVHIAHQAILNELVRRAQAQNKRSILITFDPHPRDIIEEKGKEFFLLTTVEERIHICGEYGIDYFLVLKFDREFAQQSFLDFYKKYIINGIGISEVLEGYNHHFGRERKGNIEVLERLGIEYGFNVIQIAPVEIDGVSVSSSSIREALIAGNMEQTQKMLGRPYSLRGYVVEGDKRGRSLGFPTANLQIHSKKLIPRNGIYVSKVEIASRLYFGLTSIGVRPTFYSNGKRLVEVNILDFQEDIYGISVTIHLLKYLRDEIKFSSTSQLIEQMNHDKETSRILIKEY